MDIQCISLTISIYFNWSKATYLTTELKAEPQQKATFATTTQCTVQRIATNKNELERLRTNPKLLTTHVQRSLWFAIVSWQFEHFKTFFAPPRTLVISATSNDLCRTRTTCNENNVLEDRATNPDSLHFTGKIVTITFIATHARSTQGTMATVACVLTQFSGMIWSPR